MSLTNVSLLTGNLQPKGHPFYVDQKTIAGAAALLAEKPLAAHLSHEGAGKERLGSAIGFFRGIYQDGLQLRAKTFEFLDSFKANFKATYDNLAELAQKFPEQFGVSLHLKYTPVWVMHDGSEVPAKIVDGRLAESAPPQAVRGLPSARVTAIPSGDFVTSPAANLTGLLSGLLAEIDINPTVIMSEKKPATFDQAALDAKLAEQKQALTAELSTTHQAALDEVTAKLAEADKAKGALDAKLAAEIKAKDELAAKLTAADKAKEDAVTALSTRDSELTATLASVGVKVTKIDQAEIKTALTSRVSHCAQEFLAARGMKPLAEVIKSGTELETTLSTDDAKLAAYEAMPAGPERIAFLEEHQAAIWRAHTGKK